MIWVTVIDKPFHIFPLESAVASSSQSIGIGQPSTCPLPHCAGVNMKETSYLSSS